MPTYAAKSAARASVSTAARGAAVRSAGADTGAEDPRPRTSGRSPAHELYRVGEVAQIIQISRRQLQYWAQTDLVRPSVLTPGGHARYSFEDLVALRTAKRLIDAGVSVQRIRKSIRALRQMLPAVERPLAEVVLVATGDVVLAFKDDTAFDAVSGQEWVFEVAQLAREIETWRASERTRQASPSPTRTTAPARAPDRSA